MRSSDPGLHVVSWYQYGKPGWVNSPSDFTRGYDGGVADTVTALRLHGAAGGPDTAPIFFSVDEPLELKARKSLAPPWFQGLNSVLGAWQTKAWSGGKRAPGAVLFQREVVTAVEPGALADGVSVDVDDVLAVDFGQWDLPR